jgi:hypothetical protein
MAKGKTEITVKFKGATHNLETLLKFLKSLEYCGYIGATRELTLWVDGDGAGQIDVKVQDSGEIEDVEIEREAQAISEGKNLKFYLD